ncbi:response regulator transcription factor [Fimbriimonas ginsengisoli]|uniref:Response regulator receiver domain protein (CheY-like) n=1 Tax=Fimbriimonas ginsengisoli Gsoil 348 TaxID=661478 RepID=A0A068NR59_FIMGI|nr:response regulator transcription factor [Fimbriimonas ginsengisoli]AIE85250.1 response regulator receiver domain protein (CheY-like) [Fimbriimonas ginsengisoli Gsoil 348]
MRLLVVEDDEEIAEQIARTLRGDGFNVDVLNNGTDAPGEVAMNSYGLVVLDIMLPGMDGWAVCRELRKRREAVPVLMLTARDSVDDRVRGLEDGADDYLVKPFDARELLARVRALLRRDKVVRTGVIRVADMEIDSKDHRVSRAGQEIRLTPREYSLLEALARNVGRTLTREAILERVWDSEENTENAVNFHVTSLRKKVDAGHDVKLIHTVHGFGYVMRSPDGGT